jgi:Sap, sulfolipid-1-addressing protein
MAVAVAVLPLAFVMIAGPQIISSFFLATSGDAVKSSLGYVAGAALSITTVVSVAYVLGQGASGGGGGGSPGTADIVIDWVILILVLFLIAHAFLTRKTSSPPSWMGKLQQARPRFAFLLGLALLGVFPTDIASSITVGLHVARHGDAWWQVLPFIALTLLLLGLPLLGVLLLGKRAQVVLPKIRDWMNDNAWVVSEVVLVFFAYLTISSLLSD